jgi:hypothetical protein
MLVGRGNGSHADSMYQAPVRVERRHKKSGSARTSRFKKLILQCGFECEVSLMWRCGHRSIAIVATQTGLLTTS